MENKKMRPKKKNNQKFKLIPLFILSLLVGMGILGIGHNAMAATYYMNADGSEDCSNLHECFTIMKGGDTLIIRDGVYTGDENTVGPYTNDLPPNGDENNFTIIKAEHAGEAIFDGEGERVAFNLNGLSKNPIPAYLSFKGILFKNSNAQVAGAVRESSHIKIIKCGFITAGVKGHHSADSLSVRDSSYILLENCYSWGDAFYHFIFYHVDHSIARRCVVRHDTGNWVYQGGFVNYQSQHMCYQNCIVIDSDQKKYYTNENDGQNPNNHTVWAFLFANSGSYKDIHFNGCIALNGNMQVTHVGDNYEGVFTNLVGWDTDESRIINNHGGGLTLRHCTLGVNTGYGVVSYVPTHMDIYDSLIYSTIGGALYNSYGGINHDYVALYNNDVNFRNVGVGEHDICSENSNAINPLTGTPGNGTPALKYLPRIENGSDLKGAASDGGDIGANILYKIGRDGTLWGDPGYDEVTNEPLWPFPNEDLIKQQMSQYTYDADGDGKPEITGKRGFCADGTGLYGGPITLTSYIWEYLGHPCPADICNYNSSSTPDTTPPTLSNGSPSGTLSANTTSTTLSITTNENVTCRYSTTANTSYDDMPNTFATTGGTNHSTTITGLTNGNSYTYYVRCQDTSGNANTTDYPISFSIANPTPVYTIDNFISLITHWLGIGDQNSDVNNDGVVNARDLGIIMHYWK